LTPPGGAIVGAGSVRRDKPLPSSHHPRAAGPSQQSKGGTEQVRVLAESVLRDAGYEVLAATAVEGAQALLNSDQSIDLLFVDVNLGGDLEAGLRIAQSARERRPLLPVVYTTGQRVDDGKKALFADPYLFLPKPYTSEQLISSMAYLLTGIPRMTADLP